MSRQGRICNQNYNNGVIAEATARPPNLAKLILDAGSEVFMQKDVIVTSL